LLPLPDWLLEANRAGPADLTFVSLVGYGPHSYLLFPVIPPPWSTPARRDGSPALSPATGISAGSLDWWILGTLAVVLFAPSVLGCS